MRSNSRLIGGTSSGLHWNCPALYLGLRRKEGAGVASDNKVRQLTAARRVFFSLNLRIFRAFCRGRAAELVRITGCWMCLLLQAVSAAAQRLQQRLYVISLQCLTNAKTHFLWFGIRLLSQMHCSWYNLGVTHSMSSLLYCNHKLSVYFCAKGQILNYIRLMPITL